MSNNTSIMSSLLTTVAIVDNLVENLSKRQSCQKVWLNYGC